MEYRRQVYRIILNVNNRYALSFLIIRVAFIIDRVVRERSLYHLLKTSHTSKKTQL
nr:MAG TPA: hypothetical protein [Caudoviricetes sp.]